MAKNLRIEFIESVHGELLRSMDRDEAQRIIDMMTIKLDAYELTQRSTEIAVLDRSDYRIIDMYIGSCVVSGKSDKTLRAYRNTLIAFMESINKPLLEVNAFDVRIYLAKKKQDGVSNSSVDTYRATLSAFYTWLLNEEIISKNPMVKVEKIKCQKVQKMPFSDIDKELLKDSCKNKKERAIVEFLLATGVRAAELCNMNLIDIDFQKRTVHVINGKGGKDRTTYITDVALMHLKAYLNTRNDTDPCLFRSQRKNEAGEYRYSVFGIEKLIKRIGKRSGVSDVHPHRFRRTFATDLARRGMEVRSIQQLMGHSEINTTMIYISNDADSIKSDYKKFA